MEKYIFNGLICDVDTGDDNYNSIGIESEMIINDFDGNENCQKTSTPIIKWADNNIYGRCVTIRFCISEKPIINPNKAMMDDLMRIEGKSKVDYSHAYSEYTGYLWTNEEFKVGGHDIKSLLISNIEKYIH
jgi:hypothetical protein